MNVELEQRVFQYTADLEQNDKNYTRAIETSPDAVVITRLNDGKILDVNQGFSRISGFAKEEVINKSTLDLPLWARPEERNTFVNEIKKSGSIIEEEIELVRKNGQHFFVLMSAIIQEINGEQCLFSIAHDITVRKQTEKDLKFASFAMDHAADCIYWINPDANFIYVNNAACKMLGYTRDELLSMSVPEIDPDVSMDDWLRDWEIIKEKKFACFERQHKTRDGLFIPIEVQANHLEFEGREYNCAIVRDISDRKKSENELLESKTRLQNILDSMFTFVGLFSTDGILLEANRAPLERASLTRDQVIGQPFTETYWWSYSPVVQEKLNKALRDAARGKTIRYDERVRVGEDQYITIDFMVGPLYDSNGNIIQLTGSAVDISERKKAEELLTIEKNILAMIANGQRLNIILNAINTGIEELIPDSKCSILLLDKERKCLHLGSALNLSSKFNEAVSEIKIGPRVGSCGTAAYNNERVIVSNIMTDPLWEDYKDIAIEFNLQSCCSTPIHSAKNEVLGTFAIFYSKPVSPTSDDLELIDHMTHLAGIAIERNNIEQILIKSEEKYRSIIDTTSEWIWEVNLEGKHTYSNKAIKSILGYEIDEFIKKDTFQLIHKDERDKVRQLVEQCIQNRTGWHELIIRWQHKNGEYRYLESNAEPILENNKIIGFRGSDRDITDRKLSEQAISELQLRNEYILESAGEGIYGIDLEGKTTFINRAGLEIIGWSYHDLIGKNMHEVLHHTKPDGSKYPNEDCPIYSALKDGLIHKIENEVFWRKDGTGIPVEYTSTPIQDNKKKICGAVIVFRDITERKKAILELQVSEERFRSSFEYASIGKALVSPDHTIMQANLALCCMLGYTKKEIVGLKFADITHPDDIEISINKHRKLVTGEINIYHLEKKYIHKDGHTIWGYLSVSPVFDNKNRLIYVIAQIQDISDRKSVEEALKRSKDNLHFLYEENPTMYFTIAPDGIVQSVNTFGAEELGYTVKELTGKSVLNIFPENFHQTVQKNIQTCLKEFGKLQEWEIQKVRKDGKVVWVKETGRAVGTPEGGTSVLIVCRDITQQKLTQDRLKIKINQDEFIADLGRYILHQKNIDKIFNFAVSGLAHILNVEFSKILELMPDGKSLLLRSGFGWHDGLIGQAIVGTGKESQAGYTLHCREPVVVEDINKELRFNGPELLTDHGVISGISIFIEGRDNVYGVLGVHSKRFTKFTQDDINFVQTISNMLGEVIGHHRAELNLQFTHRALEVLSQCNDSVVRATNEQSLLNKICDIIINTGNYRLAWVGYPEQDILKSVNAIARSGRDKKYLDTINVTWADEPHGQGPTGMAIRTGKPSIIKNTFIDPNFKPWRNSAYKYGFTSAVGLPLIYDNEIIGSLTIYAMEENAFNVDEVNLLLKLADNLAYGIIALRREKQRNKNEAEVTMSRQRLRNLAIRLQRVREEERTNIAREIHDDLGQTLTGLKMDLSWIQDHLPKNWKKLPARFNSMMSLVDKELEVTRNIALRLRPAMLDDLGLVSAIEWEVQESAKRIDCTYSLDLNLNGTPKNSDRDTNVFRILQEALTNIARHAKAKHIHVVLNTTDTQLKLEITDDGVGILEENLSSTFSLGLIGMHERATALGGEIEINAIQEGGTRVALKLPLIGASND